MGTDAQGLCRATLHRLLKSRIRLLRDYLDERIPESLRQAVLADDILQEVWVAAYRTAPGFQPIGPDAIDRWLIRITHAKLVDAVRYIRRQKRGGDHRHMRDGQMTATFSTLFARLQAVQRTPSQDAHLVETTHVMLMALNQLTPRQRRAVELHFLQGYSHREIAAELDTTEKAAKELVHRGLRALHDILGPATKYFTDAGSTDGLPADEAGHD
jgi:RNA polymerase sigma factor (sigma-70 family)